jgi:hypothetical protein
MGKHNHTILYSTLTLIESIAAKKKISSFVEARRVGVTNGLGMLDFVIKPFQRSTKYRYNY